MNGTCKICQRFRSDILADIPVCNDCYEKSKKIVKDYVRENDVKVFEPSQIHKATGIPLKMIDYLKDTGFLEEKDKTPEEKALEERQRQLALLESMKKSLAPSSSTKTPEPQKTGGFFTDTRRR